jgi:hypothetical protein
VYKHPQGQRQGQGKYRASKLFCDFSTPNADGRFNVYDDIKAKLIARGVPLDDISLKE